MKTFVKRFSATAFLLTCGSLSAFGMDIPFMAHPASGYAQGVVDLTGFIFILAAVTFVLFLGLLLFFIFRYRATTQRTEGVAIHGNTKLEIFWTVVPFIIMVVLGIASTKLVVDQWSPPANTLIIKVTAFQFGWKFEYFQSEPNGTAANSVMVGNICGNPSVFVKIRSLGVTESKVLTLPKDVNVRILVTSTDVLHSFWVPDFLIKKDTVPGRMVDMWLSPDVLGSHPLRCAELCGSDHSIMTGDIEVVPEPDFKSWLETEHKKQNT